MTSPSTDRRYGVNPSIAIKAPCRVKTTAAITLNGLQTIDSIVLAAGDRVLVNDQSDQTANGIYVVDTGDWTRDIDANGNRDLAQGTMVAINSGTNNSGTVWRQTTADPITIGTSSIVFVQGLYSDLGGTSFLQAGAGAVARTAQNKMRDEVHIFDFMSDADRLAALAATLTDATVAMNAAITSLGAGGGTIYIDGYIPVDPITITTRIRFVGKAQSRQVTAYRSVIAARGNQTHILMWKGGDGDFYLPAPPAAPQTLSGEYLDGIGMENVSIFGGNFIISDAAVVTWNAGNGNMNQVSISNVWGTGWRFRDSMDLYFNEFSISDCGDNGDVGGHTTKPAMYCDPLSSNNVNNLKFTHPHFESIGWTILDMNSCTDSISIIGGKLEQRTTYAGQTSTDLTFNQFSITSGARFSCDGLNFAGVYFFTGATFAIAGGFSSMVINSNVFNVGTSLGSFIALSGSAQGYIVKNNVGYNIGSATNNASGSGIFENTIRANDAAYTNTRVKLDAVSHPILNLFSNPGGTVVYGSTGSMSGSLLGQAALVPATAVSDAQTGVLVPIGYPYGVRAHFRVFADVPETAQLGYRNSTYGYTAIRTGVALPTTGFGPVTCSLTPDNMLQAREIVLIKETTAANVYIDGGYLEYTNGYVSDGVVLCTTLSSGTNIGVPSNVSMFECRHNYGAHGLIAADINNGAKIISAGATGFFTTGVAGGNEITLSMSTAGQMLGTANVSGRGITFRQTVVSS